MANYVGDAEGELIRTLHVMHRALAELLNGRVSMTATREEADSVDTAVMQQSRQAEVENERVSRIATAVKNQVSRLQDAIRRFPPHDEDARLDAELRHLNAQYVDVSQKLVAQYDEAGQLCASLEREVLEAKVPDL